MEWIDAPRGRAAHRLYIHFVWPTLGRIPLISRESAPTVERHVIALCRRLDVEPVSVRAFSDRLHLLLRIKPGHSSAALVSSIKGGTEAALQGAGHTVRWGRGYAAGTVSGSEVRSVMRRIHRLVDRPMSVDRHDPETRPRRPTPGARRRGPRGVDGPVSTR
jgi:REP element-mobilizing transposase RayT